MKKIIYALLLNLIFLFYLVIPVDCFGSTVKTYQEFNNIINSFIAKKEKSSSGQEYREGRKILKGKLNNTNVVVVLFTIEGIVGQGNISQFLAVFANQSGKLIYKSQTQVGGIGIRFVNFDSLKNNILKFDTEEYLPSDALCCPSGKGKAQYAFINNNLIELSTK